MIEKPGSMRTSSSLAGIEGTSNTKSFSGSDIRCYAKVGKKLYSWASLQTITVSTARSMVAVRGIGSSEPLGFTRGVRTIAGTLIFAIIDRSELQRIFNDLYKVDSMSGINFADALPPFDIHLTGENEGGGSMAMAIKGVILSNTGTTISVDDLMQEETFTYIAQSIDPLTSLGSYTEKERYSLASQEIFSILGDDIV